MNIALVSTTFPRWRKDNRGPVIWNTAMELTKHGLGVKVLTIHSPGSAIFEVWDGIPIHRVRYLPDRFEVLQKNRAGLPAAWQKSIFLRLAIIPLIISQVISCLRVSKWVDLYHANWTISAISVWIACRIKKKPFILTIRGSDIRLAKGDPFIAWVTKTIANQAAKVISISKGLKSQAVSIGINEKNIIVIPNGVDTHFFKPLEQKRDPIILFVGSLTIQKGVLELLQAYDQFQKEYSKYRLVIIGDGPLEALLKSKIEEYSLSDKVKILGSRSQQSIRNWLQRVKVVVLASTNEGLGVVLIEALACGTPVIGTRSGGIPDIITRDVGILIPDNTDRSISRGLRTLLSDEHEWIKKSKLARTRAQTCFDWAVISKQIVAVYRGIPE